MARNDPTIYMRIPQELKDALDRASDENRRSLTAEVVARLKASFEAPYPAVSSSHTRSGAAFHLSQAASETAGSAGQFIDQDEHARRLALGASAGSLAQELWEKQKETDQEELRKLIAAAVGPTIQDFLKEFEERERKERLALIERITGASAIRELTSDHLAPKTAIHKKSSS